MIDTQNVLDLVVQEVEELLAWPVAEPLEIDREIQRIMDHRCTDNALIYDMMSYHMGWKDEERKPTTAYGGKRTRPILCLSVCEAISGTHEVALPVAAAIELVHNSSTMIDDIHDQSPLRRNRPAAWTIWGARRAMVAGLSFQALMNLATLRLQENGVPPGKVFRALCKLSNALLEMCEGQFMDISFENTLEISIDDYFRMLRGKTAALIECATYCGALLATDDAKLVQHYERFGRKLGTAFQIVDDILGIWGEPETTGKPQADDLRNRKKTLPVLYGLTVAESATRERIKEIYSREWVTETDCTYLFQTLTELGAKEYCHQVANQYLEGAVDELCETGIRNPAQERLVAITSFVGSRAY